MEDKEEQENREFNSAQTIGVVAVVAFCLFFFLFNAMARNVISFDYIAILFAYLAVVCFYSFTKFKNIYHFIIGLGFALVFTCTLILYFINLAD